jgi:hypothetical protein
MLRLWKLLVYSNSKTTARFEIQGSNDPPWSPVNIPGKRKLDDGDNQDYKMFPLKRRQNSGVG